MNIVNEDKKGQNVNTTENRYAVHGQYRTVSQKTKEESSKFDMPKCLMIKHAYGARSYTRLTFM
jgi:glucose-6-phosphate isomerase